MKVRSSVRRICENCRIIRRKGIVRVICTNPPYGERLMDKQAAGELYRAFGKALRQTSGWRAHILSSHEQFESCFGKRANKHRRLYNGTIPCRLFIYE